jgi:hypothetical protein
VAVSWQKRLRIEASRLYGRLNRQYFNGELPKLPIALRRKLVDGNSMGTVTFVNHKPVRLDISLECWTPAENKSFLRATLIHEMMHVKLGHTSINHPPEMWNAEAARLSRLGALVETL